MEAPKKRVTLAEIASELGVATETLRNWHRLGVITLPTDLSNIQELKEHLISQGRLSSRANKLLKKGDKSPLKVSHWQEYESTLDDSYRNREGIYYTPRKIVVDMLDSFREVSREELSDKKFLDPCCGVGNFLKEALDLGFKAENIYGFDTDKEAVKIARRRVKGANIECKDFLSIAHKLKISFDYIYTNPPWGKHLTAEQQKQYAVSYDAPRKADTSGLFMSAALSLLSPEGKLGFLIQEALLNIGSFEWIRERILRLHIESITDYGRPFRTLMTRAQGVIISNVESTPASLCECKFAKQSYFRRVHSFAKNPKRVINFWATQEDMNRVEQILSTPHSTLNKGAKWGLGIVTGDNKRHCSSTQNKEFDVGVIRGNDITKEGIAPAKIFINKDLTRYQQYAPRDIYDAQEKLIYKFISKRLLFCVDREQRYPLNSANCVVLSKEFGATSQQVADLLNSEVINWLFERLYHSHKILRGDVETLPLHIDYFKYFTTFDEEQYCKYLGINSEKKNEKTG